MATAAPDLHSSRKRVLVRGTLFTPDGALNVWIRDVHSTGALITCKDRLPARGDVALKRGPVFVAGHIKSSSEAGAEIEFYRELSDDNVFAATLPTPNQI